jgi:hypothetical protein
MCAARPERVQVQTRGKEERVKRLSFISVLTVLVLGVAGAGLAIAGNGAKHTKFTGTVGLTNPCNSETLSATGPVKVVYHEKATRFVVHLTFKARGTGSLGNRYLLSYVANGRFAAPTGSGFFDVPARAQAVSRGPAPNFAIKQPIRVFVANGAATGATLLGPATTTCHG